MWVWERTRGGSELFSKDIETLIEEVWRQEGIKQGGMCANKRESEEASQEVVVLLSCIGVLEGFYVSTRKAEWKTRRQQNQRF